MNFVPERLSVTLKTIIDYLAAILSLILLSPVILLLSVLIKVSGKGPVIYKQRRVGMHGNTFVMYKFRTMFSGSVNGVSLVTGRDDKRITSLGWIMRKYKLDEIPNFINVLKGEMAIVGPRPEQPFYSDKIVSMIPDYKLLQSIKPGVTSWGQVKYGYASNLDQMIERVQYDFFYLRNRSFWFDMKIVYYTIGIILKGDGI
jgi:lipopolysaccharide/colanic/teichoic acid biosynthesis glycosyltransferase